LFHWGYHSESQNGSASPVGVFCGLCYNEKQMNYLKGGNNR
jgi:hypothetical protein